MEMLLTREFVDANEMVVEDVGRKTGSTAGIPTSVNKSANIALFNRTSNGLSQPNDGDKFTSNSHGFKFSSINISKPYNSVLKNKIQQTNLLCVLKITYQNNCWDVLQTFYKPT